MSNTPEPALRLQLNHHQTPQGLKYQLLSIELTRSDRIIEPQDLVDLELPPGIDPTSGVVISGRAPVWLFAYLVHECHPTSWVACYDPRLGAVVAATHTRLVKIGQVIPIQPPNGRQPPQPPLSKGGSEESPSLTQGGSEESPSLTQGGSEESPSLTQGGSEKSPPISSSLCPALMIVGPPNSGKSVVSHALFQALLAENPDVYLQRAHWDGEGNYLLELGEEATAEEIEAFKARNRGTLTERFFPYHAEAILNLRRQKSLVIVDVGGMVQPEKQPILEACTHYLIISSQPEAIPPWHEFCQSRGNLKPVAVIFSVLTEVETIHNREPYIEMTCGPWICGQARMVPPILLKRVQGLLR